MRFRKTLTFLIMETGSVFALPARAQQNPLTQDQVQVWGRGKPLLARVSIGRG